MDLLAFAIFRPPGQWSRTPGGGGAPRTAVCAVAEPDLRRRPRRSPRTGHRRPALPSPAAAPAPTAGSPSGPAGLSPPTPASVRLSSASRPAAPTMTSPSPSPEDMSPADFDRPRSAPAGVSTATMRRTGAARADSRRRPVGRLLLSSPIRWRSPAFAMRPTIRCRPSCPGACCGGAVGCVSGSRRPVRRRAGGYTRSRLRRGGRMRPIGPRAPGAGSRPVARFRGEVTPPRLAL